MPANSALHESGKHAIMAALDAQLNKSAQERKDVQEEMGREEDVGNLADWARGRGLDLSEGDQNHFVKHWTKANFITGRSKAFPGISAEKIRKALHEGFAKAIGEAGNLPLDTYWLPDQTDQKTFAVVSFELGGKFVVIIATPKPEV